MKGIHKDLRPLVKRARKQGWTVDLMAGGHVSWCPPDGDRVVTSATPSDVRAIRNARAWLRRAGLAV